MQNTHRFRALADPIAAIWPSDGQALRSNPLRAQQRIAQFSRDTIMSGHTLVGLIALVTFGIVMLTAGAVFF